MGYQDEVLGYMYIAEQVSPEDNKVSNLIYKDGPNVFYVEFDTILQTFATMNRNHRIYLASNIAENLKTERILDMLSHNGWFGEMNHPIQKIKGQELTPERINDIDMDRRSHKIINPVVTGDILNAKIQTSSGTEAGRGMASEIIQGLIPCFSCRAIAFLQTLNGKPTVIVRKIITYDWVLYPSHKEASMQGTSKVVQKNPNIVTESTLSDSTALKKFQEYTVDMCLPLSEILSFVGSKDRNAQMVLESFDLSMDDIVGFSPDKSHLIIKDRDNRIYTKMSPRTQREVKDFFSSF